MVDYSKHSVVLDLLSQAQEVEYDNREAGRESDHFVNKRDGQWEPSVVAALANRPRYTFDQCNPILDQISGEIERTDFSIKVNPAGGDATKDVAKTYDGIIRNIENISQAKDIYHRAGERAREVGIAGWRVIQDWVDGDSFDQDLLIKPISNFIDRVWLDPNSELVDGSDAEWAIVLEVMTKAVYEERYPKGSGQSLSDGTTSQVYTYKKNTIAVGELLWRKRVKQELVLMSSGQVFKVDDDFTKVQDELAAQGITEIRRRERMTHVVYSRIFDNDGWLTSEQETVFQTIPIVVLYSNHKVSENKVIYRSVVEKLIDPQRVYNYAKSRQIEEGALAPRGKYWMTKEQAQGHTGTLETLNTNADPVQFYNHIDNVMPPTWQGGAQVNIGLQQTAMDAQADINKVAGMFSANLGDNPGLQTGVAIERVQNKGDNSTYKYFSALKAAIAYTAQLCVKAIPLVYDTERQIRLVGKDGTTEMVTVNTIVTDEETGESVALNDLAQGAYDVTASIGPAFQNKQQEAVKAIIEAAQVDASLLEIGSDVLLNNINAPGMDTLAERKRAIMVMNGLIPESQLTEEEKAQVKEQMQNPPEPSPMEQAVLKQAEADATKAEAAVVDIQSKIQDRQLTIQLKQKELELAAAKQQQTNAVETDKIKLAAATHQETHQLARDNLEAKIAEQQHQLTLKIEAQIAATQKQMTDQLNTHADTLKKLAEAIGVDAIISPELSGTLKAQAATIAAAQDDVNL